MTFTEDTGAHVTPERIRADGAAMERAGVRLVYERPLADVRERHPKGWSYSWWEWRPDSGWVLVFECADSAIPGEQGRMA